MPVDLNILTFDGVPMGSCTDFEPHEIPQGFARNIIDAWVDSPGLIRQRGPINPFIAIESNDFPEGSIPLTIFQTKNPLGRTSIAVFYNSGSNTKVRFYEEDTTEITPEFTFPTFLGNTHPVLSASSAAIGGGSLIGITMKDYGPDANGQWLFLWKGGLNDITFVSDMVFTQGDPMVGTTTGDFTGITPGMFLESKTNDDNFTPAIGVVKRVVAPGTIELESPALWSNSGATDKVGIFTPFKGLSNRISTGLITASTGSVNVVGSDTKFQSQRMEPSLPNNPRYYIYRRKDYAFVGKVNAVISDVSLTLTANAAVAMSDDEYIAIDQNTYQLLNTNSDDSPMVGFITTMYADRQWYANLQKTPSFQNTYTNRLWFSEQDDAESLDTTQSDGNFLTIDSKNNDPIVGLFPLRSSLLIFTHNEVFALTGTNPNQFRVSRLSDDGALTGMAIADYHGGVIWAGKRGVYIYDGIKYQNLLASRYSKLWLEHYDSGIPSLGMQLFRVKDKIIAQDKGKALDLTIVKGRDTEIHRCAVVIDIPSNAIVWFTNCAFYGAISWLNHNYGLVKSYEEDKVNLVNMDVLFSQTISGASTGLDTLDLIGDSEDTKGPRFFLETSRYSAKQLLQLKTWKRLIVQYFSTGALKCDLVTGIIPLWPASKTLDLPDSGYTWDTLSETFETWDDVAVFNLTWDQLAAGHPLIKRFKFLLRSQLVGLRFYTAEEREDSVQIASWALGFKWMRPGRV